MRNAFADEITKLGSIDPRVVMLSGDIGNKLFDKFKEENGERFYNCGVAEANMMGMAAGLALSGLRPVVYTITPFTTTRCFEQIRVDVCYHEAPVIIVGTGAGLSYASLGPTHHSVEDIAILRTLPGMSILCPCDQLELRAGLKAALNHDGPVYMRIGKKNEPVIYKEQPDLTIGKAITIREGDDIALINTGNMMPVVLEVADKLKEKNISARVESFHTVKPLDTERLKELFEKYKFVVVVEEHGLIGGLGSSVAEWLVKQNYDGHKMISFGTSDNFLHELGSQNYARKQFGLTSDNIFEKIISALNK